jgi:NTP pyrophosphatase (non-canonical NTP hydrolase)
MTSTNASGTDRTNAVPELACAKCGRRKQWAGHSNASAWTGGDDSLDHAFVEPAPQPAPVYGPKKPEYEPDTIEQRLGYLVEECGEVLHAAGKSIRWGLDSYNPELPKKAREANRDWLKRELGDLKAAIMRIEEVLS